MKTWFYFFLVWLNDIQLYFFKQSFEFLNSHSVLDTHITFKWAKKQANLSPFYASPLWNMVCCRSNADLDGIYFESRLLDSNFYRKRLWKFKLNIYFSQVVEFWRKKKATETINIETKKKLFVNTYLVRPNRINLKILQVCWAREAPAACLNERSCRNEKQPES